MMPTVFPTEIVDSILSFYARDNPFPRAAAIRDFKSFCLVSPQWLVCARRILFHHLIIDQCNVNKVLEGGFDHPNVALVRSVKFDFFGLDRPQQDVRTVKTLLKMFRAGLKEITVCHTPDDYVNNLEVLEPIIQALQKYAPSQAFRLIIPNPIDPIEDSELKLFNFETLSKIQNLRELEIVNLRLTEQFSFPLRPIYNLTSSSLASSCGLRKLTLFPRFPNENILAHCLSVFDRLKCIEELNVGFDGDFVWFFNISNGGGENLDTVKKMNLHSGPLYEPKSVSLYFFGVICWLKILGAKMSTALESLSMDMFQPALWIEKGDPNALWRNRPPAADLVESSRDIFFKSLPNELTELKLSFSADGVDGAYPKSLLEALRGLDRLKTFHGPLELDGEMTTLFKERGIEASIAAKKARPVLHLQDILCFSMDPSGNLSLLQNLPPGVDPASITDALQAAGFQVSNSQVLSSIPLPHLPTGIPGTLPHIASLPPSTSTSGSTTISVPTSTSTSMSTAASTWMTSTPPSASTSASISTSTSTSTSFSISTTHPRLLRRNAVTGVGW
ncbi:hypothetical protein BT69DRAFT_1333905 [Atractiella rhizophila]|nr:hypothetical protein BT69DRAFT_1333905 [Atractiella rhizophila]